MDIKTPGHIKYWPRIDPTKVGTFKKSKFWNLINFSHWLFGILCLRKTDRFWANILYVREFLLAKSLQKTRLYVHEKLQRNPSVGSCKKNFIFLPYGFDYLGFLTNARRGALRSKTQWVIYSRYLLRFFDCLVHPNLSATFATDQKWPICHLRISYQSLAGSLRSLKKSEFLKLIISYFH